MAGEHPEKRRACDAVEFEVVGREHDVIEMPNRTVHLVDCDIAVRPVVAEVSGAFFHVRFAPHGAQGVFDQFVPIRCPHAPQRKSRRKTKDGWHRPGGKLLRDQLRQPAASALPVDIELCYCREIVLLLDVQSELLGDTAQKLLPTWISRAHRCTRPNEDTGGPARELIGPFVYEPDAINHCRPPPVTYNRSGQSIPYGRT